MRVDRDTFGRHKPVAHPVQIDVVSGNAVRLPLWVASAVGGGGRCHANGAVEVVEAMEYWRAEDAPGLLAVVVE